MYKCAKVFFFYHVMVSLHKCKQVLVERKENSRKQHQHLVNLTQCCLILEDLFERRARGSMPCSVALKQETQPFITSSGCCRDWIYVICHFMAAFLSIAPYQESNTLQDMLNLDHQWILDIFIPTSHFFLNIFACFTVICGRIVLSVLVKFCASRHSTAVGNPPEI